MSALHIYNALEERAVHGTFARGAVKVDVRAWGVFKFGIDERSDPGLCLSVVYAGKHASCTRIDSHETGPPAPRYIPSASPPKSTQRSTTRTPRYRRCEITTERKMADGQGARDKEDGVVGCAKGVGVAFGEVGL
jgi:hypothetical protein